MGRGGRGGGKGSGGGTWFRRIPGFNRIFGPSLVGNRDPLHYVAIARGVRNVDQLLLSLGKQRHEISYKEAIDMLQKEGDFEDFVSTDYYRAGKGYRPCNALLERYLESVKAQQGVARVQLDRLKKYCSYTDDELRSLT